ncbi:hypothetical protein MBANPS3_006933 [Mucor bainieri]
MYATSLIEWLTHSRKKYCELCEHPFTFTPVYRQDMPEVLPPTLFIQQLRKKLAFAITTTLRAILVSSIWLILLPYFTIWIWRLYFFLGANLSRHLSRLQDMKHQFGFSSSTSQTERDEALLDRVLSNDYGIPGSDGMATPLPSPMPSLLPSPPHATWFEEYKSRFSLQTFLADCFEGQIITCVVVVVFVAVFLLREWIVQNIPMDAPIIEDDDVVADIEEQQAIQQQQQPREEPVDNLFDNHWDHQNDALDLDHRPPSPVATTTAWLDRGETSATDQIFIYKSSNSSNHNNNNHNKPTRATSMPPSLSATSSFYDNDEGYNGSSSLGVHESLENRRSASMEPYIDTTPSDHRDGAGSSSSNSSSNSNANGTVPRGHPPNAPRLRHAEAPRPIIRPIFEELEEDEDEAEAPHAQVAPAMEARPQQQQQQQQQQAANEADDDDDNIEEFEGVLEAIGMQGSLWSLLQNSALMGLLIALSLGAAVWMPYLIGMLFIMTETLDVIRIPLKLTRIITDPIVDFLFYVCTDYISPWLAEVYTQHLEAYWLAFSTSPLSQRISIGFMSMFNYIFDHGLLLSDSSNASTIPATAADGTVSHTLMASMAKFINDAEPVLESAFHRYQALATGQTALDRFACISVGYIIVTIVSCWYLARSTANANANNNNNNNNNNNTAAAALGRTAQEAIRHQGIIFKVGMFITIELILFPIVCGFLLDLSTLPLFRSASVLDRFVYLRSHPVPSVFLHWFLGTGFMFLFAVLVTLCRDIVRPGVMWFIRDPNDPQFHPIREIVERPILFQFRKIGASALIYLTVILVGVGGVVHCIDTVAGGQILPLRWNLGMPLSVVPVDLIIIHVGIPAIVRYFKPKQTIKQLFVQWITLTCRQLRLSSFMFGGRKADEEGTLVYHSWTAWLKRTRPTHYPADGAIDDVIGPEVSYLWEGQLLRVPRHDSVPIIERRRMLVPVDNITLEPIDDTERRLGHPAASAPGGDEVNTVIVYSPPHFKERVLVFVGFMWLSTSLFFCAITVLPVLLGRYLFARHLHIENEVHDIYSFVLGGCIMLFTGALLLQCYQSLKDIASQSTWFDLTVSVWRQVKKWTLWTARWAFFVTAFGFLVPFSFGLLIELYLVLPFITIGKDAFAIEVLPMWAAGFVFQVILHGSIQVVPNNRIKVMLDDIFQGGINEMKVETCCKKLLVPLLFVTMNAACLPFLPAYINVKILGNNLERNDEMTMKLLQMAYPIALVGVGSYYLGKVGSRFRTRLVQNIREDNYLIGRTLHNLDQ